MRIRLFGLLAGACLVLASLARGAAQSVPPTPPPPIPGATSSPAGIQLPIPPPPTAAPTSVPSASASPRGRRPRSVPPTSTPSPGASPSETPAPPQFTTLDGTWELEAQTRTKTYYSHFTLSQSGQAGSEITGLWDRNNKKMPLSGTFDGRLFKFTVVDGTKQYTLSGYVENFSDMVGLVIDGTTQMAFTAQHRKHEKAF